MPAQPSTLMSLGLFVFGIDTLAFDELRRSSQYRHAAQNVVGGRPKTQYLGPGEDSITLAGRLYPTFAGMSNSLDTLRTMAEDGRSWPLITGTGVVLGAYVIDHIDESQSHFTPEGAPRRYEFTLALKRVDAVVADNVGTATAGDLAAEVAGDTALEAP